MKSAKQGAKQDRNTTMITEAQPPPPSRGPPVGTAVQVILTAQTDPATAITSLLDVVKTQTLNNQFIQEIHLMVDPSFHVGILMTESGREMMKVFGRLANLKSMIIRGQFRAPFPVSALSRFFLEARGLVRFSLFQMCLVGSVPDFERFGQDSVSRHSSSLEIFDIDMIHLLHRPGTPPVVQQRPALDPLLRALNQSNKLQVLLLGGCEATSLNGTVSSELVHQLFLSKTIQRLSLVNFPISMSQVCSISQLLETNDCLKSLCLSCGSNIMMTTNAATGTPLPLANEEETRSLVVSSHHDDRNQELDCKASLSSMLHKNKTLEKLILFLPGLDEDENLNLEIFRSVEKSETLKGLYLGSLERISSTSRAALMQMLQKNFVLEEFGFVCANKGAAAASAAATTAATSGSSSNHVYPCSVDAIREMTMLLRLNKDANRGKLLQNDNATREEWVDALINVQDDLDCCYHLLSLRPSLMMDPQQQSLATKVVGKRVSNTKKKRKGESGDDDAANDVNESPSKRKRLYRAVKYMGISYR